MIHDRVEIDRWKQAFSLARLRREARDFVLSKEASSPQEYPDQVAVDEHIRLLEPTGEIIFSPHDVAVVEQLRAEVSATEPLGVGLPTDVFVFGKGEPDKREVTKLGGLPYLPADKRWPYTKRGDPATFIAQFCFADSSDIAVSLPADLLLIFGDQDLIYDLEPAGLLFEWVKIEPRALITSDDVPETQWIVSPCFGAIHRTFDYLDAAEPVHDYGIAVLEGTKIGGAPSWIQEEELRGNFLCSLGPAQPAFRQPYPYLNVPDAIDGYLDPDLNNFMLGDMGSVYIFIQEDGDLRWTWQCH